MLTQHQMTFVDSKHRSPEYEAAVAALEKLGAVDIDLLERAFAEVRSDPIRNLMTKGLKRSSGQPTPYRLFGKRNGRMPKCADSSRRTDLWLKDGKPCLWTTQPYNIHSAHIQDLGEFVAEGFQVDISASRSWWFPGSTMMVELSVL